MKHVFELLNGFVSKFDKQLNSEYIMLIEKMENDGIDRVPTFIEYCQLMFIEQVIDTQVKMLMFIDKCGLTDKLNSVMGTEQETTKEIRLTPQQEIDKMLGDLGLGEVNGNNLN